MACTFITYNTPNESAFLSRKRFHSSIKDTSESVEDWFHRLQQCVSSCNFGALSNVFLIDKFISGLDVHLFDKLSKSTTLTVEQTLSIATISSDETQSNGSFESVKPEFMPNLGDFLSLDLMKNEDELIIDDDSVAEGLQTNGEQCKSEFDEKVSEEHERENKTDVVTARKHSKNERITSTFRTSDESVHLPKTDLKGSKLDGKKHTVCLDCGKSFALRPSYILHRRLHTGENLHRCEICSKPFLTRPKLRRHMTTHKDDGRSFECYLCPSTFNQFSAVRKHFDVRHIGAAKKEELACTFCDKTFRNPRAFELHVNIHKGIIDALKCPHPHCDKKFDKRAQLLIHLRVHSDFREFVCETCGIACKTKKQLKGHVFTHTGEKPYKCGCGKSFRARSTYNNHLRVHSGERPFKCELCGRTFARRANMLKHLKIHRQERSHACTMCPKRFTASYDLKIHQSVHTGCKPFSCSMCDKSFTQLGTLRAHKAKAHPTIAN